VTVAQPDRLAEQAGAIDDAKLMGAIDALSAAVAGMREGDDPRLTLEVALLKVTSPSLDSSREALLRRIELLEAEVREGRPEATSPESRAGDVSAAKPPAADKRPPSELSGSAPPAAPSEPEVQATDGPAPEAGVATATIDIARVVELWPAVVGHLQESGSAMLSTLFDGAKPMGIDEERGMLRIGFPASAKFNKRKAESSANIERMTEAIGAVVGTPMRPAYELLDEESGETAAEPAAELSEEDKINLIKDTFDATEVVPDDARESEAG
jgi:hypothetical protein